MKAHRKLVLVACAAGLATGARAEAPAGVLTGHVFDQTGSPLRGVMIVAARKPPETLFKKTFTSDDGAFRIGGLPAGLYDVTAGAPKLRRLTKRDVSVSDAPAPDLNLIMEVEGVVEQVRLVEKAPLVSASRVAVKEIFDAQFYCVFPPPATRDSLAPALRTVNIEDGITLGEGWRFDPAANTEHPDNPFLGSRENPVSTFSIDVDTPSYADVRRSLVNGSSPPLDAVRIEGLLNYSSYNYPAATGEDPMSVTFEVNDCPWNADARLVRIGIRGRSLPGTGTHAVARDVKLQVELNPTRVVAYRLIGYENRPPQKKDDRKDAGELGAGETVTALYEIIPPSAKAFGGSLDETAQLRHQRPAPAGESWDLLTVEARYKLPGGWFSKKRAWAAQDAGAHLHQASVDFRFAAAVAAFGMILRDSPHRGTADLDLVLQLAGNGLGADPRGARRDFLQLVRLARDLQAQGLPISRR